MANLLSDLLSSAQQGLGRFVNPPAPQVQQPQQGQNVSLYPGYKAQQGPPPQVDFGGLSQFLGNAVGKAGNALSGLMQKPLVGSSVQAQNLPAPSMAPAPLLSSPRPAAPMPTMAPTPVPTMAPISASSADPSGIKWLETQVLPITRKAGLPDALVAGQWAIEGRKQNTAMFNMLYPEGPNGKRVPHTYQNVQNNVDDYIYTVNKLLKQKGTSIEKLNGDPEAILNALQDTKGQRYEAHSAHPEDYLRIIKSTPEYQHYYGRK